MDKLISLGIALTSFVFYKILEYFHLFRFLQVILALLMFVAICYGISPILKLFGFFAFDFTDSFSFSSTSEKRRSRESKKGFCWNGVQNEKKWIGMEEKCW